MKYLVVSDIHGNSSYISYLFRLMSIENPDKVIILGDMISLNNNCLRILDFIEEYKDKVIVIKGNCDFECYFPDGLLDFYKEVINDKVFVFTHGHLINYKTIPCDVFVSGHTHLNNLSEVDGVILFNPGSLANPRGNTINSYGLITDDELIIKDTDNNVIKRLTYRK